MSKDNVTPQQEAAIRKAFKAKDWNEIKTSDSWAIFKVMSEFVSGFETLAKIGPCVSIFGSARTQPDTAYYRTAEEIGASLVRHGFGVITGGGPGIMEAGPPPVITPNPCRTRLAPISFDMDLV